MINRPINTSMDFFKLVFLFILISFFNFATTKAQDSGFWGSSCSGNTTTSNSTFHLNLKTLLSYLSSNATGNKEFYNTTVASKIHSDIVYGLFMCRGDIPSQLCGECVRNATQKLSSNPDCSLSKEAVIWHVECMVRYSNHSFFSIADLSASSSECSDANASKQASFMRLLSDTMNQTADDAAYSSSVGDKKYATKQATISGFQSLYCLAQCTPDLSPQDCRRCLSGVIAGLEQYCKGSQVASAVNPTCNIRYDLYPFYRSTTQPAPTGLVPTINSSLTDSKYSQDPGYLSHNCSSNETIITNSAFLSNLRTLLSSLSSNATSKTGFYKTTIDGSNPSDTVNGLFMCRGDISPSLCQLCVLNATQRISLECHSSKEAVIWFNHCLLRYSYRSFFSTVDTSPIFHQFDIANTSNLNQQQSLFTWTLVDTLSKLEKKTSESSTKNYGTISVKLNDFQTLYTLGQCTPDLSNGDCVTCLQNIFRHEIPWCCLASPEGKFLYPSCYMMFGLSQFYRDGDEAEALVPASPSPGSTEKRKRWSRTIILIVVPTVAAVMLFCFGYYLLRRKERKRYKTILKENFGDESATLEPLQFDLAIIEAATNNFSQANMIGKGGFGEVYKGILLDGRQIAVKRLSKSSKQGAIEFKTEILLIAKLQHRNLVAFIGFCLKEEEKILVYEYVPNGSLDYFLFDIQQQKLLNWSQRYKIIGGIARGILYLHEYSRLKVIHRDLKPSNVLLDENMNPKLSDFGIARIVEIDQHQESTNRIVGTFGYMSPEYAMLGHFSEKSDVFSFGVMILEIISGKKNLGSYESHRVAAGLLSYVWRQWRDHTPLSILDPRIKNNYSEIEVIKCIQIGLLCVQENSDARPTMVTVISYLSNHSIKLPSPQEPAFSHRVAQESSSGQSINNSSSFSINEMSISECLSR